MTKRLNVNRLGAIVLPGLLALAPTFAAAQTKPAASDSTLAGPSGVMLADHTMRTSKLIGSPVYNDEGDKIGTVDDIIVTAGAVEPTVVVSVGGYLGIGEKLATEPLSHLKLAQGDKMMMPGTTKASMAARPAFSYHTGLNEAGGTPFIPPTPVPARK